MALKLVYLTTTNVCSFAFINSRKYCFIMFLRAKNITAKCNHSLKKTTFNISVYLDKHNLRIFVSHTIDWTAPLNNMKMRKLIFAHYLKLN